MVTPNAKSAVPALAPLVVAVVALGLLLPTVMPGVGYWDTAEFQTVGPVLGTAHPTGFPSYVILGWVASALLTPLGEPAFRMNLLNALLVAAAAGATVVLVRRLTDSTAIAVAAGLALAITPIVWRMGTHADPHALHLVLVVLLFTLLLEWGRRERSGTPRADRWLVAAAFVFGIAAANHSLTLLLPPAVGLYVLAVDPRVWRRGRLVATCVAVLVATLSVLYLELPLRAGAFGEPLRAPLVYGRPDTWEGFRYVVLAEQFRGSIVDPLGHLDRKLGDLVDLAALQFGVLAPLVPVGFLAAVRLDPRYALLSGVALAVTAFFSASYVNADIQRYYLGPILIAWTWLAILVATAAEQVRAMTAAEPADTSAGESRALGIVATILAAAVLVGPSLAVLPASSAEADRSDDRGAARWLDDVLTTMEPNAIVVSWWSYSTPLWYAQHVEGRRPDIFVADDRTRLDRAMGDINDVIDDNLGRVPVYVIRASSGELARLRERYVLDRADGLGILHRVVAPVEAAR